ncbi:MAG: hypothetical protein V4677_01165 [Bacteroidota bacterium]
MQQQQFIDIIKQPHTIESSHLNDLEVLVNAYPFFESAHLLYTKGLHKHQAINYSKQLRKTAIVVNSRSVLYELLHQPEVKVLESVEKTLTAVDEPIVQKPVVEVIEAVEKPKTVSPVSVTNDDIKVIYINTVPSVNQVNTQQEVVVKEDLNEEINIIKSIENETEVPVQAFNEEKLNKTIEQEINKSIVQSYVETDIIKTPELNKEEISEPGSFTEWLKAVQKEAHTFQIETKTENGLIKEIPKKEEKKVENDKKPTFFSQNKQIIDKIIESDPGRIKLGTGKFFTPAIDAKQSLLENEHLVTETLAKIYALQGNISKAIRAYEILSLKFPQKSVYFASLIEKLKTNK